MLCGTHTNGCNGSYTDTPWGAAGELGLVITSENADWRQDGVPKGGLNVTLRRCGCLSSLSGHAMLRCSMTASCAPPV